jgi:hypothetical protein
MFLLIKISAISRNRNLLDIPRLEEEEEKKKSWRRSLLQEYLVHRRKSERKETRKETRKAGKTIMRDFGVEP